MSWGKHHASMYEGSMRGKGSPFFAVWGYVLSHMKPVRTAGTSKITEMNVDLNVEIIAFLIGEEPQVVHDKIEEMCQPDPQSRTPDNEGRKLVKRGEYTYLVVNGLFYRSIRNEEERREYQCLKQAEYRKNKATPKKAVTRGTPLPGETAGVKNGVMPGDQPPWVCKDCDQKNSGWSLECGRCGRTRALEAEPMAPPVAVEEPPVE